MRNENIIQLLSLFIVSCGVDQQHNKNNRDWPPIVRSEEADNLKKYSVQMFPLSETVGNIAGNVEISINQTEVSTSTQLTDVPQTLMVGRRFISNEPCDEIAAKLTPMDILTNTIEFKNLNFVDNGSKESLIAELNRLNSRNGDSIDLVGKSYVIEAYIESDIPVDLHSVSLVPIVCGLIQE